jgi:hypothetical protein
MVGGIEARRSARARVAHPQSQISSTNSSLSGRTERNSRHFKAGSPPKSTSTGSLSSEPPEDTIMADDTFGTRRRTRGQGDERDRISTKIETIETANDDDDAQEEDEAVRCICGFDDYPGPPPLDEEIKTVLKESTDIEAVFPTDVTDESAGFFVQCDVCKVWQHGACVGIMTEESSPDEYFCEGCRRDLHKIFTASNGYVFCVPKCECVFREAEFSSSLLWDDCPVDLVPGGFAHPAPTPGNANSEGAQPANTTWVPDKAIPTTSHSSAHRGRPRGPSLSTRMGPGPLSVRRRKDEVGVLLRPARRRSDVPR